MIKEIVLLLVTSSVLGLGVNLFSPNKIPYVGTYRELSSGDGPIVPPSAMEGDPPFIDINTANMEYATRTAIFLDARDSTEFICATIPGSISIPFEQMPEEQEAAFVAERLTGLPKDQRLITFCSGEECDLSLHLARFLKAEGYTNVEIFFGGASEWKKFEMEFESRQTCDQ
jgi:rhodanese-related sulfurtransferase